MAKGAPEFRHRSGKITACPHCHASFPSEVLCIQHVKDEHPGMQPWVCPRGCGKGFTNKYSMNKHVAKGRCSGGEPPSAAIAASQSPSATAPPPPPLSPSRPLHHQHQQDLPSPLSSSMKRKRDADAEAGDAAADKAHGCTPKRVKMEPHEEKGDDVLLPGRVPTHSAEAARGARQAAAAAGSAAAVVCEYCNMPFPRRANLTRHQNKRCKGKGAPATNGSRAAAQALDESREEREKGSEAGEEEGSLKRLLTRERQRSAALMNQVNRLRSDNAALRQQVLAMEERMALVGDESGEDGVDDDDDNEVEFEAEAEADEENNDRGDGDDEEDGDHDGSEDNGEDKGDEHAESEGGEEEGENEDVMVEVEVTSSCSGYNTEEWEERNRAVKPEEYEEFVDSDSSSEWSE